MLDLFLINADNFYKPENIIVNIFIAFIFALIICVVYRKTHKGLSYSQSFTFTLFMITIVGCVLMMVVGNSLARAFALFGAFSIIRFRTAIKDSRDIAFVFFALVIGMAVGTNNHMIALISTILICLIIVILSKINFGSIRKFNYILNFSALKNKDISDRYQAVFDKYLQESELLNVGSRQKGKYLDYSFNVRFFDDSISDKFASDLHKIKYIQEVDLISAEKDIEY